MRAVARTAPSPDQLPPPRELLAEIAAAIGLEGTEHGWEGARARGRSRLARVITLYDAARCPYCARARIVLAEKGVPYETVEIDLTDRPPGSTS